MPATATGPFYPGTSSDGGGGAGAWSNTYYVNGPPTGGLYASGNISGGGSYTNYLLTSNYGFVSANIPATAIIDGIVMSFYRYGTNAQTQTVQMIKAGSLAGTVKFGTDGWPATTADWISYGSATDLWGTSWSVSDINNSGFGVALSADNTHGGGSAFVGSVRLTVYWHTSPTDVPIRYDYKVYSHGAYIGNLPRPSSEFAFSQEINTGGSQITIEVPYSDDSAGTPATSGILDETGAAITDETGDPLLTEGAINIAGVGLGSALIKNGNRVVVIETSYYYPNGRIAFQGEMERWEANFGGDSNDESIKILCYSDGQDLDNYLVFGSPYVYTADRQQTSQNATASVANSTNDTGGGYNYYGQTFTVGSGVTNIGAILVKLNGTANITVSLYASPTASTALAAATLNVNTGGAAQDIQFNFDTHVIVTPGTSYFFTVTAQTGGNSITIYYQNTDVYSGGTMYNANYAGGSGGGSWGAVTGNDLYFKTFSSTGTTTATFTNEDPTTGMVVPTIDDYRSRGGLCNYATGTIDATGLSLTYGLNTNTVYELLQAALKISPDGFYYYVDIATSTLYFKMASNTADILLVKGKHINKVTIIATIENMKNLVYFSGGVVSGSNLYKVYSDGASIGAYGPRLDRQSDNRVTVSATADAIGNSAVAEEKDEQYETTVSIPALTMDISLFKPGQVIGFRGFGTFVDTIIAQIVRIDYTPGNVSLTLGIIPRRLTPAFEKITRGLIAEQTIANPTTPS